MEFIEIAFIILITCIAMLLQLIVHEIGHMIGGLLSGYKIIFIRFGSLTLIKEEKWKLKKFNVPGTGGQCIMQPTENKEFHYKLYFLGGVIMNAIFSMIGIILFILFDNYLAILGIELAFMGTYFMITNGLPLKIGGIVNDGYHVFKMKESDKRKLYSQLMIGSLVIQGTSLSQIDESLFQYDESQDGNFYDDYLINVNALKAIENNDYPTAKALFSKLLQQPQTIELMKTAAKIELIILNVEEFGRVADIDQYIDKKLIKVLKQQKFDLSALLAYYCILVIKEHDQNKAKTIEEMFIEQKDHVIEKGTATLYIKRYENIKKMI